MEKGIELPSLEELKVISPEQAWHYRIVVKKITDKEIIFLTDTIQQSELIEGELELLLGRMVRMEAVAKEILQKLLEENYPIEQKDNRIKNLAYTGKPDNFVSDLITEAKKLKSSDIHIEIYENKCRVRIRIDGLMVERYHLSKEEYPTLINKVKIMANLDIAEKRLPQDGRIFFSKKEIKIDIRVSVLPTLHGEKIVLRLLNNDATSIDINGLGFSELDLSNFLDSLKKPHGIILISGPTGSGKTTTLYATLKLLNKDTCNIVTIEDPIEYTLEGVNQVQLKESIGLSFGSALKTFLRQDPDVIMVGEIRDPDTASMAIRAALTGHLVLSTIHTNSAWGTVSRLIDMGVPPFLLSNTLNTTAAQRLVRLLCRECKRKSLFDKRLYPKQFKPFREVVEHYVPIGCEACYYTGYRGRKAVYEVIPVDGDLAEIIKSGRHEITEELKEKGIKTLSENAFELFELGETSIDEIYSLLYNY